MVLSRAGLHARQPCRGISKRVAGVLFLAGRRLRKRLHPPRRARATTVWRESNVSNVSQIFFLCPLRARLRLRGMWATALVFRCWHRKNPAGNGAKRGPRAGELSQQKLVRGSEPSRRGFANKLRNFRAPPSAMPGQPDTALKKKSTSSEELMLPSGGSDRRRSGDLSIFSRTLYQLSYRA